MNPMMSIAVYFILWWLAFFMMLPLGAHSPHETGEATTPGVDRGAPRAHRLGLKALLAAVIAALLWLVVAWAVSQDLFMVRAE